MSKLPGYEAHKQFVKINLKELNFCFRTVLALEIDHSFLLQVIYIHIDAPKFFILISMI